SGPRGAKPHEDEAKQMDVAPISDAVGVAISGVDLKQASQADARAISDLFHQHGAVLFRDQQLDPEDLVRFSSHFGALDEAPVNEAGKTAVAGFPEIYVVSNILGSDGKAVGSLGAGEAAWHTDMSYLERPPKASLLYCVECPKEGGNTWLAGMRSALEGMPAELRAKIDGRRIKHDGTFNSAGLVRLGMTATDDPVTSPGTYHPIVCRHPESGADVLYLGRRRNAHVEGLSREASDALLDALWDHATNPRFTYGHQWRVGDVLMWDNRATLHRRDPFDASARRYMLRTQIRCETPPEAAAVA
ncbi:MAG: TauD/TfdA family dioxygenase, partial [Pseudomonadota bacterium]